MDLDDLVTVLEPPTGDAARTGRRELRYPEGAVMLAYAMHLMREEGAPEVRVHPDGEHAKQFDLGGWLARRAFAKLSVIGSTHYGGVYRNALGQTVVIDPRSGRGDVVAEVDGITVSAECKGGMIDTKHPGQVSRLYKGLCEVIGMLMAVPAGGRQVAVVPLTDGTRRLAERLAPRCTLAGIEIVLMGRHGEAVDMTRPKGTGDCRSAEAG